MRNYMTLNNFEEYFSSVIIDRGYDYFVSDCVDSLEKVATGKWFAEVFGSEIYSVEVNTKRKEILGWNCDCPYDYGPVCKHVVAVFYAITEQMKLDKNQKSDIQGKKSGKDNIQEISEKVSKDDLMQFVLTLFKSDRSIKNRFIAHFAELLDEDLSLKYKTVVRNYYKSAKGRHGFIDYRSASLLTTPLYELADKASEIFTDGNLAESLAVCKSLIEEVPEFINNMDDSDGGAGQVMNHAFDTLSDIAVNAPPILKDELFDYCITEFSKQKYRDFGFEDYFLSLLPDLVASEKQEKQFMKLIDRQIESEKDKRYSSFQITRLTKTKVDYLLKTNREKEAFKIVEEHDHFPAFREMLINRAISEKNFDKAKNLCHEGIRIAGKERFIGHVRQWQVILHKIAKLEENIADQQKWAETLFLESFYKMEWYRELKSTWPEKDWPEKCDELIKKIKDKNKSPWQGGAAPLANIYVEEGYDDRLLKLLQLHAKDIVFVDSYSKKIVEKYPYEVLDIYEDGIKELIKQTGRKVYRQVARYLQALKKLKGGDERAYKLLKQFLAEYSNRPAMKDEFKKVFPVWVSSAENSYNSKR